MIEQLLNKEAVTITTNHIFLVSTFISFGLAAIIWLAPKPVRKIEAGAAR